MKKLTSQQIRAAFLHYFTAKKHTLVPSSSLVPQDDPTLLFTNAGMVQFKDVFLGREHRDYVRATSAQKCVRAGGKHNDLERVGYTARHHTFFEMLGNFSFGDYFKREAIQLAWEFLTVELQIPAEKLWVTVYEEDNEAADIWLKEMQIDPARFSRCGADDNFWSMGATGPCGPCTEIFYDHGRDIAGGPPGSETADGDRYIEIWNLVFMQYDRDIQGQLTPLPKPSVDTGMGLERLAAVLQHKENNFDTDLFQPLIQCAAKLGNIKDQTHFSLRVIADHIRSASFLIADGVHPSNEGRGYVLRRIIRRAIRHGYQLNLTSPFFYLLVPALVEIMGDAFPELKQQQAKIESLLRQEEEQFSLTLAQGLKLFAQVITELKSDIIPGATVFKLYDTYGFPVDLVADLAREKNLKIDMAAFELAMAEQKNRSREKSQFASDYLPASASENVTLFTGHADDALELTDVNIIALYKDGQFADQLSAGDKGAIVLDRTPFYAESGGQVGDQGTFLKEMTDGSYAFFKIIDTIKQGQTYLHLGKLEKGALVIGDKLTARVDANRRQGAVLNHTATHLLHHVLKSLLGDHVMQKGSLVEPERLRFDFTHSSALTPELLETIELQVNAAIRANAAAETEITTREDAVAKGAIALFGEKYGKEVRMVRFGNSIELCGGTHAHRTGDVGLFKITSESAVAAGIRRIEAVTGAGALAYIKRQTQTLQQKLAEQESRIHGYEKEIQQLKMQLAANASQDLITRAISIGNTKLLAISIAGADGKALRTMMDELKTKLGSAVIVLATVKDNKVGMIAGVTGDLTDRINAKDLINMVAAQVGGKGGGRADLAEAGGNQPANIDAALTSVVSWVTTKLKTN